MPCIRGDGFVLCLANPTMFILDSTGNKWRFEFSDRFGPTILDRKDDPKKIQPSEKSPFWDAFGLWLKQGKRTENVNGKTWAKWDPHVHDFNHPVMLKRRGKGITDAIQCECGVWIEPPQITEPQ